MGDRTLRRSPLAGFLAARRPRAGSKLGKAQLRRFLEARLDLADRPDLAGEADLAEDDRVGGRRTGQLSDEIRAAATARSAAGSPMRRPPATLR